EGQAEAAISVATAQRALAEREHSAAALRRGLNIGDACPICGEPITSLADHDAPDLDLAHAAVAEAERLLAAARAAHQARREIAAAAHAHTEALQAALALVEAKLVAVDGQCEV